MPVPAKRRSSSKLRRSRSQKTLKKQVIGTCPKCGKSIMAHNACSFCGNYKGKEVLKVKVKTKKTTK